MRVGMEEILGLKHFWSRLGGGLREKGFESAVENFEIFRLFTKGFESLKKGFESLEDD